MKVSMLGLSWEVTTELVQRQDGMYKVIASPPYMTVYSDKPLYALEKVQESLSRIEAGHTKESLVNWLNSLHIKYEEEV